MRTVLVKPASIYAHFVDTVMCLHGHTSVDQISNKQLSEAKGDIRKHIGEFFQENMSRFDSSHLSQSTDVFWETWSNLSVDSFCHDLGRLLAGRQDLSPPNAKVFRSYGKPMFIKVPVYQKAIAGLWCDRYQAHGSSITHG